MAEDIDVRIGERLQDPVCHLCAVLVESGMHRGDDDVERGQAVVGQIERSVGSDIAFDPREEPNANPLGVEGTDARGVGERPSLVEPIGHRQRLTVVRDGDVLETRVACRGCHRPQPVLAVAFGRVRVQIAAQVCPIDEMRQRLRFGRLDLSTRLA